VLLPVLAASLVAPGASKYVTIANSANITQCLGTTRLRMVMVDCITHIGAEWNWTLETASKEGPMEVASFTAQVFGGPGNRQCVDEELKLRSCSGAPSWRWNPATLQLQMTLKGKTWCLGLIGKELLMQKCHILNGTTSDDQNGYGAPAEQTWVLLPTVRPQISILDRLTFPLRTAGRHVIDSKGRRVKLAGVNWMGAHMEQLVSNGLDRAPVKRIVKTIKYMGFNSVRLGYASAMAPIGVDGERLRVPDESLLSANPDFKNYSALEVFDKVVEAITDEGLLVVICRHMREPGWCCSGDDGSELWYGHGYTTEDWMNDLTFMAKRYRENPRVIGVDIFNEPRMRESDDAIPWWGAPTGFGRLFGINFADWRVAAARGAVAVWRGNPDAIVIVEGHLYASNLERVLDRPMNLAQSCLRSRVVYSSHEYFWHWKIDKWFRHLTQTFRPFTFVDNMKRTLREAYDVGDEDEFGSTPSFSEVGRRVHADFSHAYNGGVGLISFDEWSSARDRAVFHIQDEDEAPIWVSEFGTSRKADNAWWEYVLKYFREKDVNWCYWPMDPVAIPSNFNGTKNSFKLETYGLFDTSRYDYSAVVGWKLQDLVSIMAPREDQPSTLPVPEECRFELTPNLESSAQETDTMEFLMSLEWTPQAALEVFGFIFFVTICPCLNILCCYFMICRTGSKPAKAVQIAMQDTKYLPLNSSTTAGASTHYRSGLGSGMGSGLGSFKTNVRSKHGSIIDAQPVDAGYPMPRTEAAEAAEDCGGGPFLCCTSTKRAPQRNTAWASVAAQSPQRSARRIS